jgi:hypothetical protein
MTSSNYAHAEYRLEREVLKRLRDITDCSKEEFLTTISDHVEKRGKLLERAIMYQESTPSQNPEIE